MSLTPYAIALLGADNIDGEDGLPIAAVSRLGLLQDLLNICRAPAVRAAMVAECEGDPGKTDTMLQEVEALYADAKAEVERETAKAVRAELDAAKDAFLVALEAVWAFDAEKYGARIGVPLDERRKRSRAWRNVNPDRRRQHDNADGAYMDTFEALVYL